MALYDQFAPIYQRGPYIRFAQGLAETILPQFLEEMDIFPKDILDIACGEGSFAVEMSQKGFSVTGIDQSPRMIKLALEKNGDEGCGAKFFVKDMRELQFKEDFDLVTCFFDSLNYLLSVKDLMQTFKGVYQALRPGGHFIFDMNTIYGLAVDWMKQATYVQNEADDFIEIHRHNYDYENQVASVEIIVFIQVGELWQRFDEVHQERGYPVADLQFLLDQAGFKILKMYGNLGDRTEVRNTSSRVWFVAWKPNSQLS
jgi:SAM-dependent methyltransferase